MQYLIVLLMFAAGTAWADHDRLFPVDNAKWRTECGSCHLAYHPQLASAETWRQIMRGLDKHFGENAALAPADAKEIESFLLAHSARRGSTTPSLRISDQPWFRHEHRRVSAAVGKDRRVNTIAACEACHLRADQGSFSESEIQVPR